MVQITKTIRLPDREGATNGLYSEVLLDLILNLKYPEIYKACIRTLHCQRTDNQEIEGFDSIHLLIQENQEQQTIWLLLGQAKLGSKNYCLRSIKEDIQKNKNFLYTYEELSFISDKLDALEPPVDKILESLNDFFFTIENEEVSIKKGKVKDYLLSNNIKISIPCLIAYDYEKPSVYSDVNDLIENLESEINSVITNLENHE